MPKIQMVHISMDMTNYGTDANKQRFTKKLKRIHNGIPTHSRQTTRSKCKRSR